MADVAHAPATPLARGEADHPAVTHRDWAEALGLPLKRAGLFPLAREPEAAAPAGSPKDAPWSKEGAA